MYWLTWQQLQLNNYIKLILFVFGVWYYDHLTRLMLSAKNCRCIGVFLEL